MIIFFAHNLSLAVPRVEAFSLAQKNELWSVLQKKHISGTKWWMLFSSPEPICARKHEWCHNCFFLLFLNVAAEASRCFIMMYYMLVCVYAHLDQRFQIGFDFFLLGIYLQPSFKWAVLQRWPELSSIVPLCPLKDAYLLLFLPAIMSLHLCTFSPE